MNKKTMVIVGGASTYTPGIVGAIMARSNKMPIKKIILQDVWTDMVEKMAKYLDILLKEKGYDVEIDWTTDQREAFKGADYIFAQIRVGSLPLRETDEKIALKHGVVGQETCGPGGIAYAMRNIAPMIEMAKNAKEIAPDAWIVNYSNPIPIVADAVNREVPDSKILWICDMPYVEELTHSQNLGYKREELQFDYFGLNHFGWFTSIKVKETGEELIGKLKEQLLSDAPVEAFDFGHLDQSWIDTFQKIKDGLKMFPDYVPLSYMKYYYFPDYVVSHTDANYTRANQVMDGRRKHAYEMVEAVVANGSSEGIDVKLDEHGFFIVDQAIALETGEKYPCTINIVNNGTFKNFPDDAIIETYGYIDDKGAHPNKKGIELDIFYQALMLQQNAGEKLVSQAGVDGDYDKVLKAMMLNKTVPSATVAKAILDEYMEVQKEYWPKMKNIR